MRFVPEFPGFISLDIGNAYTQTVVCLKTSFSSLVIAFIRNLGIEKDDTVDRHGHRHRRLHYHARFSAILVNATSAHRSVVYLQW
jgi:hypothetical protein